MRTAIATPNVRIGNNRCKKRTNWLRSATAVLALAAGPHGVAKADTTNVVYHGRDLGLPLKEAVAQVQATGASQAAHVSLSITGTGEQLMFTEVNFGTIEIETASFRDLDFNDVDVRKIGESQGRYGITLRASEGSVNDHIVGTGTGIGAGKGAAPDRDNALSYMDFWLVDPDMTRIRHVADLFATIRARLKEQPAPHTAALVADANPPQAAPPVVSKVSDIVGPLPETAGVAEKMPVVLPAPLIPVIAADPDASPRPATDTAEADEAPRPPPYAAGKCLFKAAKTSKHAKGRAVPMAAWSPLRQGLSADNARIFYRISAQHGMDSHQAIEFYLGNKLPVTATVVARVILTASDGSQHAEDIGLDQVGSRGMKSNASLHIEPFDDGTCITDVDVTEVHACPMPDDGNADGGTDNIFRCNADAAAGTTVVKGITYVKGREPKMLTAPATTPPKVAAASSVTVVAPGAATKAVN